MEFCRLLRSLFNALIFLWACSALAEPQQVTAPEHLNIEFSQSKKLQTVDTDVETEDDSDENKEKEKEKDRDAPNTAKPWLNICKKLGHAMTKNQGIWSTGPFKGFSCIENKKLIFGDDVKSTWRLKVREQSKKIDLSITMQSPGKKSQVMGKFTLPRDEFSLAILSVDQFADLIGLALTQDLPFSGYIPIKTYKEKKLLIKGRVITIAQEIVETLPSPPEELIVYDLFYDAKTKIWRNESFAEAILRPSKKTKRETLSWIGKKDKSKLKEKEIDPPREYLWIGDAKGRSVRHDEFQKALTEAYPKYHKLAQSGELEKLQNKGFDIGEALSSTAASGYIGMRYGKQIIANDALLKQTSFIGLLLELRGGPLSGLRIYYDKVPKTEAEIDGQQTSIEWSRLIVGKSWSFNLGLVFDALTVTPKIGQWSLQGILPADYDEGGTVLETKDFTVSRALSLAMEIGLEKKSSWYLLRGWYSFDAAMSLGSSDSSVTSNRFGVDMFWTPGMSFHAFSAPIKVSLLGFYFFESVQLKDSSKKSESTTENEAEGSLVINGVTYQNGYAGFGLALSW